ncbi:Nup133 N terminal like-domain-containing protein [Halteromyces radiatus]|uniref:Nup133 N terminal like-domain-containing protein n=1 Tax=Halteromyces radiatus TaxID=101107 RepID=UPI00221E3DCF|nr:Nup133 N terminal like-domain-containing protein [Halteromyces radiatus]KAI8099189.1 Nup133 N terminal like-domain-containing protein [Halteromyces radiatus]
MIDSDIRSVIDTIWQKDKHLIDLEEFLNNTTLDQYSCSQTQLDSVFEKDHTLQLPSHLQDILKDRRNKPNLGIFSHIHRIWIAWKTKVYIWDYINNISFCYEANEEVYQVGLVKAKPGVFNNNVKWILVVNSATFITMTGILFSDTSSTATMELVDSQNHRVKSHGIKMKSILGTLDGRIMMLGRDDGHIYELVYKNQAGMDQLTCHTDHSFTQFLSSTFGLTALSGFFKPPPELKTKAITMDYQRKLMYALTETSTIQIISLSGHSTFTLGALLTNITDQFISFLLAPSINDPTKMPSPSALAILGSTLSPTPFDIISVHPVPKRQRSSLQQSTPSTKEIIFCAVTSHGCRLYFTLNGPSHSIHSTDATFSLAHVRLPPYRYDLPLAIKSTQRVTSTFQQPDVFIATINNTTESTSQKNQLWVTSYQEQYYDQLLRIEETSDVITLDSSTVAIAHHNTPLFSDNNSNNNNNNDLVAVPFYDRIDTSIDTPHQHYLVISQNGTICMYSKQRPVDVTYKSVCKGQDPSQDLDDLIQRYGLVETYTMLLNIFSTRSQPSQQQRSSFFLKTMASFHQDQTNLALLSIYTRIVKHLWNKDIFSVEDQYEILKLLDQSKYEVNKVYCLIQDHLSLGFDHQVFAHVLQFLHSNVQIMSFVHFLIRHDFFERKQYEIDNNIVFSDLVTTERGHDILEHLVNKSIQHFASSRDDNDTEQVMISHFLFEHCPTLFGDAQRLTLYEGDEYLAIAQHQLQRHKNKEDQSMTKEDTTTKLLETSLNKYISVDHLSQETRTRICNAYQAAGFYQGVVTLALHATGEPSTLSLLNNTQLTGCLNLSTDSSSDASFTPILSLLDHIFSNDNQSDDDLVSVLQMTLPVYSQNKALHYSIYAWLIQHDKMATLFTLTTQEAHMTEYLLDFLEHDYSPKAVGVDWLYKYYDHLGEYRHMVTYLTKLALDIQDVPLSKRIDYLDLAIKQQKKNMESDRTDDDQQNLDHLDILHTKALIQQDILNSLPELKNDDRLASYLLSSDDLLDYATKNGLWDQVILLLHLSRKSPSDFDYMLLKTAWQSLLEEAASNDLDLLRRRLVVLGKQLYPSVTTFPIYLIVSMVEAHCSTHNAKKGYVIDLLLEIGVELSILMDAYDSILVNKNHQIKITFNNN